MNPAPGTPELAPGLSPPPPNPQSPPPIRTESLEKSFGRNPVLRGVNLTIPRGSVVGLIGRNGAGKSTLIKCLLGLLRPTAGRAVVLGENAWDLSAAAKERLGYGPQEVTLYPWMKVRQVVAYTAAFYPRWNHDLVERLIDDWRLPREHRVGPLSVGQLQTLAIVLALGHEPELLLLDEPVASLDPAARRRFMQAILEIAADDRRTVLFSTHITSDLERVADRVALLSGGVIAFHENLDDLKDRTKRLHILAPADLPPDFQPPGTLRTTVSGRQASLTVRDFDDSLPAALARQYNAQVSVEDLNLEELFLELDHD